MIFEWDEDKNQINIAKHKISFETALHVFDDPDYIEMYDFDHSVDEDRYIAIGKVGSVLFVVFTERRVNRTPCQGHFRKLGLDF